MSSFLFFLCVQHDQALYNADEVYLMTLFHVFLTGTVSGLDNYRTNTLVFPSALCHYLALFLTVAVSLL